MRKGEKGEMAYPRVGRELVVWGKPEEGGVKSPIIKSRRDQSILSHIHSEARGFFNLPPPWFLGMYQPWPPQDCPFIDFLEICPFFPLFWPPQFNVSRTKTKTKSKKQKNHRQLDADGWWSQECLDDHDAWCGPIMAKLDASFSCLPKTLSISLSYLFAWLPLVSRFLTSLLQPCHCPIFLIVRLPLLSLSLPPLPLSSIHAVKMPKHPLTGVFLFGLCLLLLSLSGKRATSHRPSQWSPLRCLFPISIFLQPANFKEEVLT